MRKERLSLNEILIYNPWENNVIVKNPHHIPDKMLIPRKYFAGFLLYNTYYCHGGIETNGKPLNSFV